MPGVIAAPDDAAYLLIDRRGDPLMQAIANPTIRLSHRDSGVVTAVTTDECTHDGREPAPRGAPLVAPASARLVVVPGLGAGAPSAGTNRPSFDGG
jgi:hypothetical protein